MSGARRPTSQVILPLAPVALVFGALAAFGALAWHLALLCAVLIGVALAITRSPWDAPTASPAPGAEPIERNPDAKAAAILDAVAQPLLVLDKDQVVRQANAAARILLGEGVVGRALAAVIRDPDISAAAAALGPSQAQTEVAFSLPGDSERRFLATFTRAPRAGDMFSVLTLIETTAVQAAHRQRADFVANVSHELRTPLATLVGFIETLQGAARDDPEARGRFLAIMAEQAGRMTRLVADLLSLAKIEEVESVVPTASVDVVGVIRGVADALALQARAKDMRIELELGPAPALVIGDGDQLAQVFQNLVDNAIKYGRAGTTVSVTLRRSADRMLIAVTDRGDGIPADHIPRLTERFYRVDRGRSRAQGGTGLGLAIVKHILRRHRGALEIDSAIGRGSTFRVDLLADRRSSTVSA
jgi:two-component system, OmpR family, phosphate regulon sensor histidine kinase PhoR